MRVQVWLKYYILIRMMDRTQPRGKIQFLPLLCVFITSAYWHGFYFGYHSFFLGLFMMDLVWKTVPKTALVSTVNSTLPYAVVWLLNWVLT